MIVSIVGIRKSASSRYPDGITYYFRAESKSETPDVIGFTAGELWCPVPVKSTALNYCVTSGGELLSCGDLAEIAFSRKFKHWFFVWKQQ